jgi:hypothetical protein
MRADYKKPPACHRDAKPAFAIVTDNYHPLSARRRIFLCGACGVKRAFLIRRQIISSLNVIRGVASATNQYGLALRGRENRNEEEREILPEAMFSHIGQEMASGAMLPQNQPIFHRRLNHFGSKYEEHMRSMKPSGFRAFARSLKFYP